ncbi:MAG: AAA family ATPase [Acidobacteriales bacterium]|nr:AAA family ATPase [Terriglobales bacterium]
MRGIFPDDLILVGAPSGVGKTQLCCNIAHANLEDGKTVHYIALEASEHEIERRIKFPLVMDRYYGDPNRPHLGKIEYTDWLLGRHAVELEPYETEAAEYFKHAYKGLHIHYKADRFDVNSLIESVTYCAKETDLIMIDHVHYFDLDDENENRGIKQIAKTVRTLALEEQRPIILVAHLRKRDRNNDDLVAGLDEFHGSSDLYKIATRVITLSPGKQTAGGDYETYFRIAKNRLDGGSTRFIGKEYFSPKEGGYEKGRYQIGWANQTRKEGFAEIDRNLRPSWARGENPGSSGASHSVSPSAGVSPPRGRPRNYAPGSGDS